MAIVEPTPSRGTDHANGSEEGTAVALLSVSGLTIEFPGTKGSPVHAVRGVSFNLFEGEIIGLVGESGSGKSVTALAIMGLLREINATLVSGSISYRGRELVGLPERELRSLRGRDLGMVFQDPLSSLDPLYTVGWQVGEALRINRKNVRRADVRKQVIELLRQVGLPNAESLYGRYPFEFSGGMRQRVMIATALANHPGLLIADEPTTALDVTVQAQVLRLLMMVRSAEGLGILLITHDLGVIAEIADRVLVMYGGEIVEHAEVHALFDEPQHPYTLALMQSRPSVKGVLGEIAAIPGQPPDPTDTGEGCRFQPRCWLSRDREPCALSSPPLRYIAPGHAVACHYAEELQPGIAKVSLRPPVLPNRPAIGESAHEPGRGGQ